MSAKLCRTKSLLEMIVLPLYVSVAPVGLKEFGEAVQKFVGVGQGWIAIGNAFESSPCDGSQTSTLPLCAVFGMVTLSEVPPEVGTPYTTPGIVPVFCVVPAVNLRLTVAVKFGPWIVSV